MHTNTRGFVPEAILRGFTGRTLPHTDWTHEAHLAVCWYADALLGRDRALTYLRDAIPAFNATIGIVNTDHSGYHETLTRYYVGAVADACAGSPLALLDQPACARDAPLTHWSRGVLFSVDARRAWIDPDLERLPWHPISTIRLR